MAALGPALLIKAGRSAPVRLAASVIRRHEKTNSVNVCQRHVVWNRLGGLRILEVQHLDDKDAPRIRL